MVTGASNADLAILLVDATRGLVEQTQRHAALVSLLGIRHVVLAVNKMDLVDFAEERFVEIERAFDRLRGPLDFDSTVAVPMSARFGDNVVSRSRRMPWYRGPALLDQLETVEVEEGRRDGPMRFPVQWVNRPDAGFRGLAGTVASGSVAVGDRVVIARSGTATAVQRIVTFDGDLESAEAGRAITLVLADDVDAARGDVLVHPAQRPAMSRRLSVDVVWMDERPGMVGDRYLLRIGAASEPAVLTCIVDTLSVARQERMPAERLEINAIGRVHVETAHPVAFDPYVENRQTGCFILIDPATSRTVAAGMVVEGLDRASNVHHQPGMVTPAEREVQKGQRSLVVWLTGLPASGKSTIAALAEAKLAAQGFHIMLLDGDNLRQGLNADLGFDPAARTENVRRVGEVAKLMAEAGLVVLVALVSPFRADRERAASLLPEGRFVEVFVDTPPYICRLRDPKGLYAKAAQGQVQHFTGRDQPYEPPLAPHLTLRTADLAPDAAADKLVRFVLDRIRLR
jgi:bifunctional enzyme CysN/CysC